MEFELNGKTYRYKKGSEMNRIVFEYAMTHSTRQTINYVRNLLKEKLEVDHTDDECIGYIKKCTPQKKNKNNKYKDIKLNPYRDDIGIVYRYSLQIEDDDGTVKEISYVGKSYNEYIRRNTNFIQGYQLVKLTAQDIDKGANPEDAITRKHRVQGANRRLRTISLFIPTLEKYIREREYIEEKFETAADKGEYLLSHYKYEVLSSLRMEYNIYGQILPNYSKLLTDMEKFMIRQQLEDEYIIPLNKYMTDPDYIHRENESIDLYRKYLDNIPYYEEIQTLRSIEI